MKRQLIIRPAHPRRAGGMKCIAFLASSALLGLLVAQGIPVRTHPLRPWQFVVPLDALTPSQVTELGGHREFVYCATVVFFTTGTGVQTATSDATWNNASNQVELIGGGGSGGICNRTGNVATGGGGGEYGITTNFNFATPGTTTFQYQIGQGGTAVTTTAGTTVNVVGNVGTDSWFNGATQAGATLGGIHGNGGDAKTGAAGVNGGAGGTGGVGTTHNAGGRGGNYTGTVAAASSATGGGGAGGTTAGGTAGTDAAGSNATTAGGAGGTVSGGSGGAGSSSGGTHNDGNPGTVWTSNPGGASAGAGGGGGAWRAALNSAQAAGSGGLYGAGGGACVNNGSGGGGSTNSTSGAGANGILVLTWTPAAGAKSLVFDPQPMQHMLIR